MSEVQRYQGHGVDGYSLPLDVIPGEPEQLTYETAYPQAQDILNSQVSLTASEGDNFDRRSSLRWRYLAAQQALPLGITAELAASQGGLPPLAVGLAAAGLTVATLLNIRKDGVQQETAYGQKYRNASTVGQEYELYRPIGHVDAEDQTRPVDLVWYGPNSHSERLWPTRDNLLKMAEMAQTAGVSTMYVDQMATRSISVPYTSAQHQSAKQYMKQNKNLLLESNKYFIGKTPEEWLQMERGVPETHEAYDPTTKKQLLADKLKAVNYKHALASALESHDFLTPRKLLDEKNHNAIKQVATQSIGRRLKREMHYPEAIREQIVNQKNREVRRQDMAVSEDGRIVSKVDPATGKVVDAVIWQTKYGPQTQDTMTALGITESEYTDFLNMSADTIREAIAKRTLEDPKKVAIALELAAFRLSYGRPIPLVSETKQVESRHQSGYGPERTIQDALKLAGDNKDVEHFHRADADLARHRLLQYGVGIVATSVLALGFVAGHQKLDALNDRAVETARHELAAKHRVGPETVSDQDAQDLANAQSSMANAYSTWTKGVDTVAGSWPDLESVFGKGDNDDSDERPSAVSQSEFGVGNVDRSGSKDHDQFKINAFNGASAEGFWFTGTAKDLVVKSNSDGGISDPQWKVMSLHTDTDKNMPEVLPPQYVDAPRLRVTRDLVDSNVRMNVTTYGDDKGPLGEDTFIIPVLEGTKPVAGSIDGKPVRLVNVEGNTYALRTSDNKQVTGRLDYWLVADKNAPMPEATGPITINKDEGDDTVLGPKVTELKKQLRSNYPPQLPIDNGAKAGQISSVWKYALDPFTDQQKDSWKTLDDMIADAEKNKQANCNIANTVANLSDPTTNQVVGFLNGPGSKSGNLSSFELHQKTIRQDATPTTPAPVRPEAKNDDGLDLPYGTIAGISAGIALAASQRRRVTRLSKKALNAQYSRAERKDSEQNAQVEHTFAGHPDDAYTTAAAVAEHLAYAGRPLTQAILQQSKERIANVSGARSQAILGRPHVASHEMASYLVDTARHIGPEDAVLADQLRQSATVLADGANVLAMRNGEVSTENVDRLNQRIARIKRLGRKALFLKK